MTSKLKVESIGELINHCFYFHCLDFFVLRRLVFFAENTKNSVFLANLAHTKNICFTLIRIMIIIKSYALIKIKIKLKINIDNLHNSLHFDRRYVTYFND